MLQKNNYSINIFPLHSWLDDVAYPALSGMRLWDGNVTIWSRILFHIGNEMSLAHLPGSVNQTAPRQAKSALLLEDASHAFPGSANPSQPISPCKLKMHFSRFIDMLGLCSSSLMCPVHLFLPSQHCQQQLLFLIRLLKSEEGGQTHLLLPVGLPVQEGAGCLSSCLGLWGRLGQWVYAKVGQKRRENSLLTRASQSLTSKHFPCIQTIILASAVN